MLEYRHQIQSYTCEIDALKGTVSRGQRRAKPASREGNAAPGCSRTSGLLPALRAAAVGGHSRNLGQQHLAWLCSRFRQSPGVRARTAEGAPAREAPGRPEQGTGCLVAGWELQTNRAQRSRSGMGTVTGAGQEPPGWLCPPWQLSCAPAPLPTLQGWPCREAGLPSLLGALRGVILAPWRLWDMLGGTLIHPLPKLLRVITPHQLDPGSPLLGVPQKPKSPKNSMPRAPTPSPAPTPGAPQPPPAR